MNYQFEAALCNISFLHNSCRQDTLKHDFIPRIFIKLNVLQVYLTLNQWQETDNNHTN